MNKCMSSYFVGYNMSSVSKLVSAMKVNMAVNHHLIYSWIITRVSRLQRDREGPDLSITHLPCLFLPLHPPAHTHSNTHNTPSRFLSLHYYLSISPSTPSFPTAAHTKKTCRVTWWHHGRQQLHPSCPPAPNVHPLSSTTTTTRILSHLKETPEKP